MKLKGFVISGESLQDILINTILPFAVIALIIAIAVLYLSQYGVNIQFPNPFE